MKKFTTLFATLLVAVALCLGGISDAYAKRMGGGRSFGSKPSYSQTYSRSASQSTRSASQQQAYTQNQATREAMSKRGGLMGLLGGLALGGLLGALFFGGAFEGINFMDILLFGGIAFVLFKLFAARAATRSSPAQAHGQGNPQYRESHSDYRRAEEPVINRGSSAGFDTDLLFSKNKKPTFETAPGNADANFGTVDTPDGLDRAAFLEGAKSAFRTLQSAWDKGDLAEIRGLTTDKVFAEIQEQLRASSKENRTEILKIEAELLDYREVGNELEAVVLFDTIMREDRDEQAGQVREVWHFIKPKRSAQPTWYLDGIQQLED
jgi:predicted lipid-binding transport protein (Tim44 family)